MHFNLYSILYSRIIFNLVSVEQIIKLTNAYKLPLICNGTKLLEKKNLMNKLIEDKDTRY